MNMSFTPVEMTQSWIIVSLMWSREKQDILTFEKLAVGNVRHFCLIEFNRQIALTLFLVRSTKMYTKKQQILSFVYLIDNLLKIGFE